MSSSIIIKGARENNLQNIDLELPKNKLIVITGLSGSGKSTLAFDTIYAEGQRRYLESLSAYARQFLETLKKPDVDSIEGLSPAIAINQKTVSHNPRSTVGTITEIYDYLRLLFAKIGTPYCSECNVRVVRVTIDEIMEQVLENFQNEVEIWAPIIQSRKGEFRNLLNIWMQEGYEEVQIDGMRTLISEAPSLTKHQKHDLFLLVDRVDLMQSDLYRLEEALANAQEKSGGLVIVKANSKTLEFNLNFTCPKCRKSVPQLEARNFSFNSPHGACEVCDGLGTRIQVDRTLIVPDLNKTIAEGGILPWSYDKNWYRDLVDSLAAHYKISTKTPIKNIEPKVLKAIIEGSEVAESIRIRHYTNGGYESFETITFRGLVTFLEEQYRRHTYGPKRREVEKYLSPAACSDCNGTRLKKESLFVKIAHRNIAQLTQLNVHELKKFITTLRLTSRQQTIADRLIKETVSRLEFLEKVGLGYLTLARSVITLSGGESQRIRLASQLGSGLTGILYILDEPSIGLHPRDQKQLVEVLQNLRDLGNTVIVVEHDEQTIRAADFIVDIGPQAGEAGGHVVASGTLTDIIQTKDSITGQYFRGDKKIPIPQNRRLAKEFLVISGAQENNLKRINVLIPHQALTLITGVSGSGKSTLLNEVIYKNLARKLNRSLIKPGRCEEIRGFDRFDRVVMINQAPIGRTPRSNPATYTGVFTMIRELFALTPESQVRGYGAGRFSFNVPSNRGGGRCEACRGDGIIKIEMQFLTDVCIPCEVCNGLRYNKETLKVHFAGKNIAQVLDMSVFEAHHFFGDFPHIADRLQVLIDVGLGYITLGQSATTLSGGEAQRIKLARELVAKTRSHTFYILDEPTTGLHIDDVNRLIMVLNQLIDAGNTVAMIEHNLDVIKCADWVIDLGPEGGEAGGRIIAQGRPEEIIQEERSQTGRFLRELSGMRSQLSQSTASRITQRQFAG